MSIDWYEAEQMAAEEEFYEELYQNEFKDRAVEEFTEERLSSYYIDNPSILIPAFETLNEAKTILSSSPTASLILSCIVIEVGIKTGILKPIVYGFVHSEIAADVIMETTLKQTGIDRFRNLLITLLKNLSNIDINTFKRNTSRETLWSERAKVQKIRNNISHKAQTCNLLDAELALAVGESIMNELIPQILSKLKLSIDIDGKIT